MFSLKKLFKFKPIILEILDNTIQTCLDQWVLSIATFSQFYWTTQSLNANVEFELESFKESFSDLKIICKN